MRAAVFFTLGLVANVAAQVPVPVASVMQGVQVPIQSWIGGATSTPVFVWDPSTGRYVRSSEPTAVNAQVGQYVWDPATQRYLLNGKTYGQVNVATGATGVTTTLTGSCAARCFANLNVGSLMRQASAPEEEAVARQNLVAVTATATAAPVAPGGCPAGQTRAIDGKCYTFGVSNWGNTNWQLGNTNCPGGYTLNASGTYVCNNQGYTVLNAPVATTVASCQCDNACVTRQDCCSDYYSACLAYQPVVQYQAPIQSKPIYQTQEVEVPVPVEVQVQRPVPVAYQVYVDQQVAVPVTQNVNVPVKVDVVRNYNVPVSVDRPYPVYVDAPQVVAQPYNVYVDVPSPVQQAVSVPVPQYMDTPIQVGRPVNVAVPVPVQVSRPVMQQAAPVDVPVPVAYYVDTPVVQTVDRPVYVDLPVPQYVDVPQTVQRLMNVQRPVQVPVSVARPVTIAQAVEQIVQRQVQVPVSRQQQVLVSVQRPVPVTVDVARPVTVVQNQQVQRPVSVQVDVPVPVARPVIVQAAPQTISRPVTVVQDVERRYQVPVPVYVDVPAPKYRDMPYPVYVDAPQIVQSAPRYVDVPVGVPVVREVQVPVNVVQRQYVDVPVYTYTDKPEERTVYIDVPYQVVKEVNVGDVGSYSGVLNAGSVGSLNTNGFAGQYVYNAVTGKYELQNTGAVQSAPISTGQWTIDPVTGQLVQAQAAWSQPAASPYVWDAATQTFKLRATTAAPREDEATAAP